MYALCIEQQQVKVNQALPFALQPDTPQICLNGQQSAQ
jgi:hypothetical protein